MYHSLLWTTTRHSFLRISFKNRPNAIPCHVSPRFSSKCDDDDDDFDHLSLNIYIGTSIFFLLLSCWSTPIFLSFLKFGGDEEGQIWYEIGHVCVIKQAKIHSNRDCCSCFLHASCHPWNPFCFRLSFHFWNHHRHLDHPYSIFSPSKRTRFAW